MNNKHVYASPDIVLDENLFRNNSALADRGTFKLKNANIRITRSKFMDRGVFHTKYVYMTIREAIFLVIEQITMEVSCTVIKAGYV